MTATTGCPYCHEPYTLSQCPKWIIAGRPSVSVGGVGQTDQGALRGAGALAAAARAGGDLRATMPQTAEMIDGLREAYGRTVIDAILRATSKGRPLAYFAELGVDGQLREWGRGPSGQRARIQGTAVVILPAKPTSHRVGAAVGPSWASPGRGNSDPDRGLFHGSSMGAM